MLNISHCQDDVCVCLLLNLTVIFVPTTADAYVSR